jgi:molybdate transport system substrate-binding protein
MKTYTRAALLAACIPAFTLLPAQTAAAQENDIRLICSNGFRAVIQKLQPELEHTVGRRISIQFGPSATLKRSIESGEPFDLTILSQPVVEELTKEGKIGAGSAVDIASSGVGVAVRAGSPKPDISTAQAMKETLLKAKSIGYVKVGAGTPAVLAMFNQLGISNEVQSKTVLQQGAEQSMANVADGKVDVTFGLISEILPAPGVQLAGPVPPEFQKQIVMTASAAKNRAAANQIIKSFASASAASAIKAAAMDPIGKK